MRRNPSIEEMLTLVNKTKHPRNRAFYAWFSNTSACLRREV